jgi:hypothetical protein
VVRVANCFIGGIVQGSKLDETLEVIRRKESILPLKEIEKLKKIVLNLPVNNNLVSVNLKK